MHLFYTRGRGRSPYLSRIRTLYTLHVLQLTSPAFSVYSRNMSQDHIVKLRSTESKHVRYDNRNRKRVQEKLELKKYDPTLKKVVVYKEVKK